MSDASLSLERYCSSYYDRHGLYNDGFPCPGDKYCCQTSEGSKMCCPISQATDLYEKDKFFIKFIQSSSTSSRSYLLSTISTNEHVNLNSNKNSIAKSSSYFTLLISNSSLLIIICVVLTVLTILACLLLICMCRCLISKLSQQSKTHHHKLKSSDDNRKNCASTYSRNSSSSCSTGTTSTSSSPKTNQLTICCDEDIVDEHQKILSINPSQVSVSGVSNRKITPCQDLMQKSLINQNLVTLLTHMSQNQTKPAFSSGSSNKLLLNTNNSANTTQTSYMTSLNQNNDFNEQDETDFIVSTSSNLEFLKSHSLFNSTPLNYYPSLTSAASSCGANKSRTIVEEKHDDSNSKAETQSSLMDFRFSTFLPTTTTTATSIYLKNTNLNNVESV